MLPLRQFATRKLITSTSNINEQSVRLYAGYWNKDWKPSPSPPKTESERRAAAKKYNLIPEDYEPYPDDGTGHGDYPKIPIVAAELRDPHYNWDFDDQKRNFGEPPHVEFNMYSEDRWAYGKRYRVPYPIQMLQLFSVLGFFVLCAYYGENLKFICVKKMPKQMPNDGLKHYTFELD